ncbi:MAG: CvpA family protein [Spirochaeta sp.]|nr:CvpA family protein [Spirochaeta sp.]
MVVNFSLIDIIIMLVIIAAAIRGTMKGFVAESASMAALILGIGGAILFSRKLSLALEKYLGRTAWNQIITFLLIFLVIYIAIKLLEGILHAIFEKLNLNKLDSALGFFLGIAEGLLVGGLALFVLNWQPIFETHEILRNSLFYRLLLPFLPRTDIFFTPGGLLNNV